MSPCYDAEVKVLLSEGIYKVLLKAVDAGKIDQQKAETIAEQLDTEPEKNVIGNFRRQVSSDKGFVFNRTHFREILSDWYGSKAYDLEHNEAVYCFISALKHDNLGRKNRQKWRKSKFRNFQLVPVTQSPKRWRTWK